MNPHQDDVQESKLNSAGQQAVRTVVKALPDESLSMSWRSSLNEQLLLVAAKQRRKRRLLWVASPLAGVSLATAMAVFVLIHPGAPQTPAVAPDRGLESAIMADHHRAILSNDASSAGLNLSEIDADASDPGDGVWSDSDSQNL